jgi:hypothetical protein
MTSPQDTLHHADGFAAFAKACRQLYARHHNRPMPRDDEPWKPFFQDRIDPEQAVRTYVAGLQSAARHRRGD